MKWYMCNVLYCDLLDIWPDKPILCDSVVLVDFVIRNKIIFYPF